ncbi:Unknown protein sequence [Pseudomonas syringae pv. aceris]|nr:Unknown protein sequence [Pseudomonas syringae pv. aceris]
MARELLVTFASVGCAQFKKALEPAPMQSIAGGEHHSLQEYGVAFAIFT